MNAEMINGAYDSKILEDHFDTDVINWLDSKTCRLLHDQLSIMSCFSRQGISEMSDYSHLVLPSMKALEGTLLQIGREMKIGEEKDWSVGFIFNEKKLDKYYEDVLNDLETLDNEIVDEIKLWLNDITRLIKHKRHNPIHYTGTNIGTAQRAIQKVFSIFESIDSLIVALQKFELISRKTF